MALDHETHTGIDIASEREVLNYAHTGTRTLVVLARVDLGDDDAPIAGGAVYSVRTYLNDRLVSPDSAVTVPGGVDQTTVQSRQLVMEPDDEISIRVVGTGSDTSVNVVAQLVDVTPLLAADAPTGDGAVSVDHDYGGADNLAYETAEGVGVDNAVVRAYLKSDYDAGRRSSAYLKAETTTDVDGRWVQPMLLDPGIYTLQAYKQGSYGPNTSNVTVS